MIPVIPGTPEIMIASLALVIYLTPTAIAGNRGHKNGWSILALNVLLGWTFLGWVAALIWSLTGNTEDAAIKS
jgi:hypothetical protein